MFLRCGLGPTLVCQLAVGLGCCQLVFALPIAEEIYTQI